MPEIAPERTPPIHLPVDLARDLTFENVGSGFDGWTVVHKETTGRGRWDIRKRIVIRNDQGQHYAAKYSEGATENQDYDSFDNRETYEFTPVIARTRMVEVTEYVALMATDAPRSPAEPVSPVSTPTGVHGETGEAQEG